MDTPHTILEFIKVQFIGAWHRAFDADKAIYTPNDPNKKEGILFVVCEEGAGIITYEFLLKVQRTEKASVQVWVNWAENLIHIPAICRKSFDKDITKCDG
jgi:hypothetical protein